MSSQLIATPYWHRRTWDKQPKQHIMFSQYIWSFPTGLSHALYFKWLQSGCSTIRAWLMELAELVVIIFISAEDFWGSAEWPMDSWISCRVLLVPSFCHFTIIVVTLLLETPNSLKLFYALVLIRQNLITRCLSRGTLHKQMFAFLNYVQSI